MHTTRRRGFSQDDVNFLQAAANILAAAIERKRVQATLQAVIDAVPAMINAKDANSRYIFMNCYQAALYGVTPEAAVGKTAAELLGTEYGACPRKLDQTVIATGESIPDFEERYVDAAGVSRNFLTTKVPLREQADK